MIFRISIVLVIFLGSSHVVFRGEFKMDKKMHVAFRGVYRMVGFAKCILLENPVFIFLMGIQRYPCQVPIS